MTRREAREQAFIVLFEIAVTDRPQKEILECAKEARDFSPDDFALKIINGIADGHTQIDNVIERNIKGWNIKRISKVALAVLRLAVYEILCERDIPVSVTINEAVELAKIYATSEDGSYINGVLSSIEKTENYEKDDR